MPAATVKSIDEMKSHESRFVFAGMDLGVTAWGMNIIRMTPNWADYYAHDHIEDGQEEVYVVLDGEATLTAGEATYDLKPGVFARVPPELNRKIVAGGMGATILALGGKPGAAYAYPDWLLKYAGAKP